VESPLPHLRPGLPTASSFTVSQQEARAKLDQNESALDLPAELKRSIVAELERLEWNRYPQPAEYVAAKGELARVLGVPPECLAITAGCDQAIQGAHWVAGGPGWRAVVFEPTYPMLAHAGLFAGTETLRVQAGADYRVDPALFAGKHLILLARPNNPTGHVVPEELVRQALDSGAMVFLDEAYYDISGVTLLPWCAENPRLMIGRSFSKSLLAGTRVGCMIAHPEVIARLERLLTAPYHLTHLQLVVARRYGEILPWVRRLAEDVRRRRAELARGMRTLGVKVHDSAGNFLMFEAPDPRRVFELLVAGGVRIRDLSRLPGLERHLRVTVGSSEENRLFLDVLSRALGRGSGGSEPVLSH
jgi:histidinol-phosphate aminotransferase